MTMDDAGASMSGFDMAALEHAPDVLQGAIDSGDLAGGLTLIWRQGEVVQVATRGKRDLARDLPMERHTIFRIASMSKPVTTVAALMLMEEGKLALSDPITKWAPELANRRVLKTAEGPIDDTVPAVRDITIEDLMTHRSGLAYGFSSVGPIAHAYEAALGDVLNGAMGPDAWLAALATLPLSYQPGERFHYSVSTDVLGFIVGRIAGTSFREFLIERIFHPLGMVDTDFYIPPEKRDRAAIVYRMVEATGALEPVNFNRPNTPPVFCGGGGGLVSTADDYLAFARMLLGNGEVDGVRLLKAETVALMRTNRLTDDQRAVLFMGMPFWMGQGFGLGLSVILDAEKQAWMGASSDGSFGWPGAFGTWWQADPVKEMILIYLIQNSMPLGPEAVANMGQSTRMAARLALPLWQKAVYGAVR
jgi:CubicO group peptidase (beta-lactamase class C family)